MQTIKPIKYITSRGLEVEDLCSPEVKVSHSRNKPQQTGFVPSDCGGRENNCFFNMCW